MTIWLDAQLSPSLGPWITSTFGIQTFAVRDLGLRDAKDSPIFYAARAAEAMVMTKDQDFVELVDRLGPPPKVLWVTCGNTSSARLREILSIELPGTIAQLDGGKNWVEISDLT